MPIVQCKICGKNFYIKPSQKKLGYGKYCSRKCQRIGQRKGKFVTCAICGKQVWKAPKALKHSKSKKYFCSKTCQTKWRNTFYSGTRHPNWKGGQYQAYRKMLESNTTKPICKICNTSDKRILSVHHRDGNHRHNQPLNLVWLCLNCHHLVHHYHKKIK